MKKTERNPGVELFRCLLMLSICFQHAICVDTIGMVERRLFNIGVTGFAFISGYYGVRFSISKLLRLWALVFVCAGVVSIVFGFPWLAKTMLNNWYVNAYTMLMLLSPLINEGIQGMKKNGLIGITGLILMLLLSKGVEAGGLQQYFPHIDGIGRLSFFRILYIYIFASMSRQLVWLETVDMKNGVIIIALCLVGVLLFGGTNSILFMVVVLVLFRFFERIKMADRLGHFVCLSAGSMFSIFLLHTNFPVNSIMISFEQTLICRGFSPHIVFLVVGTCVFFCALCIDFVRRLIMMPIRRPLMLLCEQIDLISDRLEKLLRTKLVNAVSQN